MAESLATALELTPRGADCSAADASASLSKRYGQSRTKVAQQRERTAMLSKPVFRRHVMKDLTKVGVGSSHLQRTLGGVRSMERGTVLYTLI